MPEMQDISPEQLHNDLTQYIEAYLASLTSIQSGGVIGVSSKDDGTVVVDIEIQAIKPIVRPEKDVIQVDLAIFGISSSKAEAVDEWIIENCRDPTVEHPSHSKLPWESFKTIEFSERDAVLFKLRWL